ncbi:DUF6296 family protein, partial [Streptomyces sp. NPDC053728]|uniref:DUF6296 family protein n=1 Tax=Streptomyces sp. NPDC053728 TaxID=3155534 RepID=UPI0034130357
MAGDGAALGPGGSGDEDEGSVGHGSSPSGRLTGPLAEDETGIVRAEISERGEVRMQASGGHQVLGAP